MGILPALSGYYRLRRVAFVDKIRQVVCFFKVA